MAVSDLKKKALGAYYTDHNVARFLATWAIGSPSDRILEPAFGEGVFLRAALDRLEALGSRPDVVGVDLDPSAWHAITREFPRLSAHLSDFFDLEVSQLGSFDAVIGNPPFIRYQRFSGPARRRALDRAASRGVTLPALASAWAPFVVHSASYLRAGGRLAMVVPFEITYAKYARPVVQYLARSFDQISILTFGDPLFPDLNENTVLLLCAGYGCGVSREVSFHHYESASDLSLPLPDRGTRLAIANWADGSLRTRVSDLSEECRRLYLDLVARPDVARLGDVARVTIGYVSGDDRFFHLSRQRIRDLGLEASDVRLAVRRGSDLGGSGLAFTQSDAERLGLEGDNYLFFPREPLSPAAETFVQSGHLLGVDARYKCRVRKPWYRVPSIRTPELLLSVLSSTAPHLIVNQAGVAATNSLLVVDQCGSVLVSPTVLAAATVTSLAQLSAEIEGHALGGGALKFEPCEAKRWALPLLGVQVDERAIGDLDALLREKRFREATELADEHFLRRGLRLRADDVAALRTGLGQLRRLRTRTGRSSDA